MPKICFVCNEIFPTKPGGAGALIRTLANRLLSENIEVILLLDLDQQIFETFEKVDRSGFPNNHLLKVYHLDVLCQSVNITEDHFTSRYFWESYRYDIACRRIYEIERPDIIEFVDYCGPAYYALCTKIFGLSYRDTQIAVRMHGPVQIIDRHARTKPIDFDRYAIYALERASFRLADAVLYSTPSLLSEVKDPDEVWFGRLVFSPPPVSGFPVRAQIDSDANIVLFYGRLYAEKGVDVFVNAACDLLRSLPDTNLEFYLIGADSNEPPVPGFLSYRTYLIQNTPEELRDKFIFTGFLAHEQVEKVLPRVKFAVFPSFFETYCYSAQEMRLAQVPIIVSQIPVFQDVFREGIDAVFFNGSANDLTQKMMLLDANNNLREKISQPYSQRTGTFLEYYRSPRLLEAKKNTPGDQIKLLVVVLDNIPEDESFQLTLESIHKSSSTDLAVLHLKKKRSSNTTAFSMKFLGDNYFVVDSCGNPVFPEDAHTEQALLILNAGDKITPGFLDLCQSVLSAHGELAYINGWRWISDGHKTWLDTHPAAIMPELLPFETVSNQTRCVFRTAENISLSGLFDPRADQLGEISFLWSLETNNSIGIDIPEPYLLLKFDPTNNTGKSSLSYLVHKYQGSTLATRLVNYMTLLVNGYPTRLLPLQNHWTKISGLPIGAAKSMKIAIFPAMKLQNRLTKKLRSGGKLQKMLLSILQKISRIIKASR